MRSDDGGPRTLEAVTIRRLDRQDWPVVVKILDATYGPSTARAALYEHWNLLCPVAESAFLVAEVGGRVVGAQPMLIHEWVGREAPLRGAVLTGVVVDPEYRRRGLFTALVKACEREAEGTGAAFVMTMPNERSRPGFLRLGWSDLGRRRLLARPAAFSGAACSGITVLEEAPPEVEDLAGRHQACFGGLSLRRTAAWWQWRFAGLTGRRYVQVAVRDVSGRAVGLAAGAVRASGGIPVGYLVDVLASDRCSLVRVARHLVRALAEAGALAVVSVVSAPPLEEALREAGFFRIWRGLPLKQFHTMARFLSNGSSPIEHQSTVNAWNLTLGDWDNV